MFTRLTGDRSRDRSHIAPSTQEYLQARHIATEYDEYFRFTPLFQFDTRALDEAFVEPGRLIDLGCGTGRHLLHFAERGFSVTGVDLSDHMLEEARRKLRVHGHHASLIKGDILTLEGVPDETFRYGLLMFSTLGLLRGREHRRACLRAVNRVLAPGGLLALHVHNRWYNLWAPGQRGWFLRNLFDPLTTGREIGDKIMVNYRGIPGMFLHLFSIGEIRRLLNVAGFTVVREYFLNEARDGELRGALLRSWRANGFILVAQKPGSGKRGRGP